MAYIALLVHPCELLQYYILEIDSVCAINRYESRN